MGRLLNAPSASTEAVPAVPLPPRWLWPVAVALAFLTYAPALDNFFIADDFNWVYEAGRTWEHPANIFSLVIANFFRPVVHVWFALLWPVAHLDATLYYVPAVALHGLCGGVVAWAAARLTRDRLAGGIAGLFFIVHFTHFDAVYWLSAISDILGTIFTTVAIVSAAAAAQGTRRAGWTALAVTPLVLMCKESMVMIVPLLAWTVWCFRPRGASLRPQAAWFLPAAALWVAYLFMQRAFQASSPHVITGYYALGLHPVRMLMNAVVNFLIPNRYIVPASLPVVALLFAVLSGLAVWATGRLRPGHLRTALFFGGWILLAYFPCSFFRNYDRIPSRYSYLPSVAFAAWAGWLGAAWWRATAGMTRRARPLTLAGVAVVAALNVAYVWRIDCVRYERHSQVSRQVLFWMQHDRALLTPETTIVTLNIGSPHRGLHFEPAILLRLNRRVRRFITVAPGAPPPVDVPEPALWYRWEDESGRLLPSAHAEAAG